MTITLLVCALLTALLSAYGLGHYLAAVVFLLGRRVRPSEPREVSAEVAVLIPARHEAERALRAITSLMAQDHPGRIHIYLLLNDRSDSSVPHLARLYPTSDLNRGPEVELLSNERHRVVVAFTGHDPKSDKINWITRRLSTPYTAILDADHQADPDWIRTSVGLLEAKGASLVQGRRAPMSARGFFALWDSLHQHIGCELFNVAFTKLGLTVYFTGTTALMKTEVLRAHPLSECITEDIDFSYTIVLEGQRLIHNPHSGSSEETSPDLYSFLARRRRWSNGHTSTFFRHLPQVLRAPFSPLQRLQFVYHGAHYLVSVVVAGLHLAIGAVFLLALSPMSRGAALLLSLILAISLASGQRTVGLRSRLAEVAITVLWLAPAVVIGMNLIQALIIGDLSRAALPIAYPIQALGLFGVAAPLFVLLVGMAGLKQLNLGTGLLVIFSYPLAFYLDLTGVLLGMTDLVFGRARWRPVHRALPDPESAALAPAALLPAHHIKESWRMSALFGAARGMLAAGPFTMHKAPKILLGVGLLVIFGAGVFYGPSNRIEVVPGKCEALAHDGEPWIVPAKKLKGYCGTPDPEQQTEAAMRTGTFKAERRDNFTTLDPQFWDRLDTTFFCNLAVFEPERAQLVAGQGVKLVVGPGGNAEKPWGSGSIATKVDRSAQYTYGRFETVMKAAKASGLITAFFLYRFDPWQEIDAEILGKDPTRLLINVYYNPGNEGDLYNYGMRGTPVLVDLGFDASEDFHRYAIEWEAEEIRWFVDDRLVHVRRDGRPTPIPHLPMRLHLNVWPICSEELAGPFTGKELPVSADIKSVAIDRWFPSPLPNFLSRFDELFRDEDEEESWREKAKWIQ
jgi:cellulose synthase/poly-beta-1,6-N-acetylglucosamine synthase-like glycosyltransferase